MASATIYELIGYAGSVLVIVSLSMSSIIRLRVINLAGAATFSVYGALIGSLPVLITNVLISGIDIYYLRKELTAVEAVKIVSVNRDDPFVMEFLSFYADDIARFRPSFSGRDNADVVFLMLRDISPAGIFVASRNASSELSIDLDYVAPPYRDLLSGAALYGNDCERFRKLGWHTLIVNDVDNRQKAYFSDMDFRDVGDRRMERRCAESNR